MLTPEDPSMNLVRILAAAGAAFIAYMGTGALMVALLPAVRTEFGRYPQVYRDQAGQMSHMPLGALGMLLSMLALALLYARTYRGGPGIQEGLVFGLLVAAFAAGAFVIHNYVNLNIGGRITAVSLLLYLVQWTLVGIVIGLIYRPAAA